MVGVSWVTYPYFEGLVFFLSVFLILLMIIVFFDISFVYVLGHSVLRRVVSLLRSGVDDRRIGRDITNVYCLDFLIGIIFNKMALLSVL